jgi:hypothetical protein
MLRAQIKIAKAAERQSSLQILRSTEMQREKQEQHFVALKSKSDQYNMVLLSLTNV